MQPNRVLPCLMMVYGTIEKINKNVIEQYEWKTMDDQVNLSMFIDVLATTGKTVVVRKKLFQFPVGRPSYIV